jgi:ATP-dependent DNA helicase RecQ
MTQASTFKQLLFHSATLRRPVYSDIASLRGTLTNQFVACTATADDPTRQEIVNTLGLKNPDVLTMPLRRENMSLFVTRKHPRSCEADLVHALRRSTAVKVLVFCHMRDEAERVSKMLRNNEISALAYHSAIADREAAVTQFESGVRHCLMHGVNNDTVIA